MGVAMTKPKDIQEAKAVKPPRLAAVPPAMPSEVQAEAAAWRDIERKLHRRHAVNLHTVTTPGDGIARNYGQLVALFKERRHELNIPQEALDDIAGFQDGYTGKLECPNADAGRSAVHMSFDLWLAGLKLGLRIVPI